MSAMLQDQELCQITRVQVPRSVLLDSSSICVSKVFQTSIRLDLRSMSSSDFFLIAHEAEDDRPQFEAETFEVRRNIEKDSENRVSI